MPFISGVVVEVTDQVAVSSAWSIFATKKDDSSSAGHRNIYEWPHLLDDLDAIAARKEGRTLQFVRSDRSQVVLTDDGCHSCAPDELRLRFDGESCQETQQMDTIGLVFFPCFCFFHI